MRRPQIGDGNDPDLALGGAIFILLLTPEEWIHRRVESIAFVDASSFRRRVSVDCSHPSEDLIGINDLDVLPIALLEKEVLLDLDVRDRSDAPLPILTTSENAFVAWSTLAMAAEFTLDEKGLPLPDAVLDDLEVLAGAKGSAAAEQLGLLFDAKRGHAQERLALKNEASFVDVATNLASNFLLLCEMPPNPDRRSIIKFAYTQRVDPLDATRREQVLLRLGWRPSRFDFYVPAVGEAQSYHMEFACPRELELVDAEFFVAPPTSAGTTLPAVVRGALAHANVSNQPPEANAMMSVWLRPSRAGLLRASLLTSMFTFLALIFFVRDHVLERLAGEAPTALLLSVPGLVSAFIVRPGEHEIATGLLLGIRSVLVVSSATAYAGAFALLGSTKTDPPVLLWRGFVALAALCFVALAVAYIGLKPSGKTLPTEAAA